jgi:PPOX class probable F420-dependent enzyme
MTGIPESHHDLLTQQLAVTLATIMPDNSAHTSVLWYKWDADNGQFLLSTTKGRQKAENINHNPHVSLMIIDPDNIYRYLEVRGSVEIEEEGAFELIDELAQMYTGNDEYYGNLAPKENRQTEERIILKIKPAHVVARG